VDPGSANAVAGKKTRKTADRQRRLARIIAKRQRLLAGTQKQIQPNRIARIMDVWRLPEGARTVVLAGRLTRWKGQSVLIDALAKEWSYFFPPSGGKVVYCLLGTS